MHPRYFIAITLPVDISNKISKIQQELFLPGKVMEPLLPHITLLEPNSLQTISPLYFIPKLQDVVKEFLPISVRLTGTNTFHNQIFHITVNSSELLKLQEQLISLLPDQVIAQYIVSREFVPHITLVQSKPKQKLNPEVLHNFQLRLNDLLPYTFQADHVTKFIWKGPRHYEIKQI